MLSLREAAAVLGYTEHGLRKIVDRSRRKAKGVRIAGPTIRFFQTTASAPIKFRPEWLEEFVAAHTVNPVARAAPIEPPKPRKTEVQPLAGDLTDMSMHWSC
jgi:hypothetical protein